MLPPFPLDDVTLGLLTSALAGEDGLSLSKLLDFLSGYDPTSGVWDGQDEIWGSYSDADVMRALIFEVRRLRIEVALSAPA
jgi:hypothetical protein